jgi:hypothetical protein
MTTNTFKVTYAGGDTTEYTSTCHSVEAFCNEHFGSAWETAKEHGATVVMNGEAAVETEAQDSAPAEAKVAAPKKAVAKKTTKAKK